MRATLKREKKNLLNLVRKPKHISCENKEFIKDSYYYVTPKADGEHKIIVNDHDGTLHLLDQEKEIILEGKGIKSYFFALEVELVTIHEMKKQIFLIFDLLAVCLETKEKIKSFFSQQRFEWRRKPFPVPILLSDRKLVLDYLLSLVSLPNTIIKPKLDATQAESLWSICEHLPYPVDGLIFEPYIYHKDSPILKWKPQEKLTIDVAISEKIESCTDGDLFELYLDTNSYSWERFHIIRRTDQIECLLTQEYISLPFATCFIPKEQSQWAVHSIIEVIFDLETMSFKFFRLRRDKKVPNTWNLVKKIISLSQQNLSLSHLSKLALDLKQSETIYSGIFETPYRNLMPKNSSSFKNMRNLHLKIKKSLNILFGGAHIIDACCGAMKDFPSWVDAGVSSVLAIDQDDQLISIGSKKLMQYNVGEKVNVNLLHANLAKPLEQEMKNTYTRLYDAIFCNFAVHYFWKNESETKIFLDNLSSFLAPDRLFVITFMYSPKLKSERNIRILNENGEVEFEAKLRSENVLDVFIASIGRNHEEYLVDIEELKLRFKQSGLNMLSLYPFTRLASLFPDEASIMTTGEKEMSSLYYAAVFQKQSVHNKESLLHNIPEAIMNIVFSHLSIFELVQLRQTSRTLRYEVDLFSFSISWTPNLRKPVLYSYFRRPLTAYFKKVVNRKREYSFFKDEKGEQSISLTKRSMAFFFRFGGETKLMYCTSSDGSFSERDSLYSYDGDGWGDISDDEWQDISDEDEQDIFDEDEQDISDEDEQDIFDGEWQDISDGEWQDISDEDCGDSD